MTSPIFLQSKRRTLVAAALEAVIMLSSAPSPADYIDEDERYHDPRHDHHVIDQETVMQESHDPQVLLSAAVIAQSRHDFALAEQLLRKSLVLNSHSDEAWAMRRKLSRTLRIGSMPFTGATHEISKLPLELNL